MKKYFVYFGLMYCAAMCAAGLELEIDKNEGVVTVREQQNVSLKELKKEVELRFEDMGGYFGFLYIENSSLFVDDVSLFQATEKGWGPGNVCFIGDVTLEFNKALTFSESVSSFSVGDSLGSNVNKPGHLTLDIKPEALAALSWDSSVAGLHTYSFLNCSYFDFARDTDSSLNVVLAGAEAGDKIAGYTFRGYVAKAEQLQEGEIAIMSSRVLTEGWESYHQPWNGSSLAIVARGADAPDLPTPEPTTGALSLLALAGLAARRRRK